jgi:hypothetical protein
VQHLHRQPKGALRMHIVKFNDVLQEILDRYPNIDLVEFLIEKLQLPIDKAEELSKRIEKQYLLNSTKGSEQKSVRTILEKPKKSEPPVKEIVYSADSLSQNEFEHFIKWLLEELGYEIDPENYPIDSGVDLIASKDGEKVAVQARRYSRYCRVTDSIILISQKATQTYGCKKSIVIATAYFTKQAIADAENNNIELWDRDFLSEKIIQAKRNAGVEVQSCFPQYEGSLLQSLLRLDRTKDFIIEPRSNKKYDVYLPGVKFPLLTFQADSNDVIRCVYRIKNNEPVGESDRPALISIDHNNRLGPDETEAYNLIVQYLEEFLK